MTACVAKTPTMTATTSRTQYDKHHTARFQAAKPAPPKPLKPRSAAAITNGKINPGTINQRNAKTFQPYADSRNPNVMCRRKKTGMIDRKYAGNES